MAVFDCVNCKSEQETDSLDPGCSRCGSPVLLRGTSGRMSQEELKGSLPGVWRYGGFLPDLPARRRVTLGEGGTPLLKAERLGKELGLRNLFLKDETRNPTGSFIDRGSTLLVSLARMRGVRTCACVTTGNLGASLAAYCAKAGIEAVVRVKPSTDRGKLYQMIAYGARIEASQTSHGKASVRGTVTIDAANPYIVEGEKTTGFEVIQDLGWTPPDVMVVPVGTGGHLSMIWKSMEEFRASGLSDGRPCRLVGVQLRDSGLAPRQGEVEGPFTELEDSSPSLRTEALTAIKKSNGLTAETSPKQTIEATSLLARTEGIFAEPSSASVIAFLRTAASRGDIDKDERIVCVVTGAGLKDPRAVARVAKSARQVGESASEGYGLARMQVGSTKLSILLALAEKPSFGYELWKGISRDRAITTASIYQHLSELEGLGFVRKAGVVVSHGRERVPYELSAMGSDFLKMAARTRRS